MAILELAAKSNDMLRSHLETGHRNQRHPSKTNQNDVINTIADVMREKLSTATVEAYQILQCYRSRSESGNCGIVFGAIVEKYGWLRQRPPFSKKAEILGTSSG